MEALNKKQINSNNIHNSNFMNNELPIQSFGSSLHKLERLFMNNVPNAWQHVIVDLLIC